MPLCAFQNCWSNIMSLFPLNIFKIILILEWFVTRWWGSLPQPLSRSLLQPAVLKQKFNNMPYYIAENSNFGETGSYFMENLSSGFHSAVPQLLSFNCVFKEVPKSNVFSRNQRRSSSQTDEGPVSAQVNGQHNRIQHPTAKEVQILWRGRWWKKRFSDQARGPARVSSHRHAVVGSSCSDSKNTSSVAGAPNHTEMNSYIMLLSSTRIMSWMLITNLKCKCL